MKKILALLLFALATLALPVHGVAFPGCVESGPNANCTVSANQAITPDLHNTVFFYDTFTVNPGVTVTVQPTPTVAKNGGNFTIRARQIDIGGTIAADGETGTSGWTLNGGNGGFITLISKNSLFLGINGALKARGANGLVASCTAGNGGTGGNVVIQTVAGASVTQLGVINVSGGMGGVVPASCGNSTSNGTNGGSGSFTLTGLTPSVAGFSIYNSTSMSISAGGNITLTLKAADEFGDIIAPSSTIWTTSNASIVALTSSNSTQANLTAFRSGNAIITARVGDLTKFIVITSAIGPFDHINVRKLYSNDTVPYNDSTRVLEITSFDAGGNRVPIHPTEFDEVIFEVTTANGTYAEITSCLQRPPCLPNNGTYIARMLTTDAPDTIFVKVRHGDTEFNFNFTVTIRKQDVVNVRIEPGNINTTPKSSTQFKLIGIDTRGNEFEFPADSWTTVNYTGSGSIDSNGTFTSNQLGDVQVIGIFDDKNSSSNVTIVIGEPSYINVTSATGLMSVVAGEQIQFNTSLRDVGGNILTTVGSEAPAYTWYTSSGTIYPNGTLVATQAGQVTVTARLVQNNNIYGNITILVTPANVYGLAIAESGATITAGSTGALTAILIDKYGNRIADTDATWTILNGTGQANINGRLLTATKIGYVTVYAVSLTNNSLTATGVITIDSGTAASIHIKPSTASIRPGDHIAFVINAFDAFGNKISAPQVNWSVSDTFYATIDSNGVLTGSEPGSVQVTATVVNSSVSNTVTIQILEPLETQSQQLAAPMLGTIPGVTIPGIPLITLNTGIGTTGGIGLTGLFTLGNGEVNVETALIAALVILLIGVAAYYASVRRT